MNENQLLPQSRRNSWSSSDYIKRKRGEQIKSESEPGTFKKSKKILRSPYKTDTTPIVKNTKEGEDMEEIKMLLQSMRDEMKSEFKKNHEETEKLRNDIREKEIKWQREKTALENKINVLENKFEQQDKKARRNNIVIKGAHLNTENLEGEVECMIKNKLGVEVKILEAYTIRNRHENKIIIAKTEYIKQKTMIMTNKNKLKDTRIYIENDLTKKELEIQRDIRQVAKKEKGKQVKIGYQKLIINGQTWSYEQLQNQDKSKN